MKISNDKKATIKDICRMTGLAIGTVSKYLNGGSLRKENVEKIKSAIAELDYKVDVYARGLKTKKTYTVGVLLPQLGNAFYGSIATAIGKELQKQGYAMIVQETNYNSELEEECLNGFLERRTDGIICFLLSDKLSCFSNISNEPIVLIEHEKVSGFNFERINVNNKEIVKKSIKYLLERGHEKIAGVFHENSFTGDERIKGFIEAFEEMNVPFKQEYIYYFNEKTNNEYDVISKILEDGQFTALFTSNYTSTLSAIFLFNKRNVKIPDDISIIGFDNMMFTDLFTPKLTIVNQPIDQIASLAVERVIKLIENKGTKKQNSILECQLLIGDSVKEI